MSRYETYLRKIAGEDVDISNMPVPSDRYEYYLKQIASNGANPEAIAEAVGDWLDDHVDPDTGYVIDNTLLVEGAAADAKKTGDEIADVKSAINNTTFDDAITLEKSYVRGYFAKPTSVNVLAPEGYSANYAGKIVWDKCNAGDVYEITATALSGMYPYIVTDNDGVVVDHGVASQGVSGGVVTILEDGYIGVNQYGENDLVKKKTGIPKDNKFRANKVVKSIPLMFNHAYIGITSPIDVNNPATASASYTGGYLFEPCTPGEVFIVNTDNIATSSYDILICDSTGAIIAHTLVGRSGKYIKNWFVKIPTNGAYIGVNCYTDSASVYKYVEITSDMFPKQDDNPFDGLKGVAFGTSLTARADGSGTYGYLTKVREVLNCTIDNQGVGGSYWYLVANDNRSVTYVCENYSDYSDKDFVIIEGCVNDWFTSKTLGSYTDNSHTSVCGCLRKMISHIYEQKPTAQIFVILDHQGKDDGTNDCSADAVVNNITQYEYYSELKKTCELYSVPVICEFAESNIGMFGEQYLVDNIHCNALGARQSGVYIAKKMQEIGIKVKA